MSDKDDWHKFFEELLSSIDLYDNLCKMVQDEIKYGGIYPNKIRYSDPNLQLVYEVIES